MWKMFPYHDVIIFEIPFRMPLGYPHVLYGSNPLNWLLSMTITIIIIASLDEHISISGRNISWTYYNIHLITVGIVQSFLSV